VIRSSPPAPGLRDLVRYYYQVRARLPDDAVLQPVPARSPQAIEFTFGTPFEVHRLDQGRVERAHPIALIGSQTFRRVDLVMRGHVDAFTIVFQPGGLLSLFSVPGETLTNDHFDGEAALGRSVGALRERLGSVVSFAERVRIADRHLCAAGMKAPIGRMAQAAAELLSTCGRAQVASLADRSGLGLRQFERRFRREIGIPPKVYARIVRFEAALQRKAAAPETRWTEIAHALGYHDQMHMVHDFNHLSAGSPSSMADRLDMFVRPEVRSGGRFV